MLPCVVGNWLEIWRGTEINYAKRWLREIHAKETVYRGLPADLPGTQSWRSHDRTHCWTAGWEQLSSGQRQVQLTHGWNHPPAAQGCIMPWGLDLPVWNQVLTLVGPGCQRNAMVPFDSEMRGYKRKSEVLFPGPLWKISSQIPRELGV